MHTFTGVSASPGVVIGPVEQIDRGPPRRQPRCAAPCQRGTAPGRGYRRAGLPLRHHGRLGRPDARLPPPRRPPLRRRTRRPPPAKEAADAGEFELKVSINNDFLI